MTTGRLQRMGDSFEMRRPQCCRGWGQAPLTGTVGVRRATDDRWWGRN